MSYTKHLPDGRQHTQILHSGDTAQITGTADAEILDPGMLVGTTNVYLSETATNQTYGPYTKSVTVRVRAVGDVTFAFTDTLVAL